MEGRGIRREWRHRDVPVRERAAAQPLPRSDLAKDAAIPAGPACFGEFSLGQLVPSRAAVDELIKKAEAAGATVTTPRDRPWGIYSGYFRDLDGHLWEIIWNPNRE